VSWGYSAPLVPTRHRLVLVVRVGAEAPSVSLPHARSAGC
jgi:hypothetical protein